METLPRKWRPSAVFDAERVAAGIETPREKNEGNPFDPAASRE